MKYQVQVKPNARQAKVEKISENELRVWVNAPPVDGKANEALIAILAEHFGVPKSRVQIKVGRGGRKKVIEIL